MIAYLPANTRIDTKKLGRLFDNMSESYKLFWFQAIINQINNGKHVISYDALINEMIADGWYMVSEYRLNLGPIDTLEKVIHTAFNRVGLKSSEKKQTVIETLKKSNDKELLKMKKTLTLNVPYRLQAPFLDDVKGTVWNRKDIADIINEHDNLLYYFESINGLNSVIRVSDGFAEYVKENYEILCGWIRSNLIEYLQKRNPSVPGIINKIDPPQIRNLEKVKRYWKGIIDLTGVHEIYEDEELEHKTISIDHFVPWSYVAHDELWNLTPTTRSINSSKSNNLPDWNKYFGKLSQSEYLAYKLKQENDCINKLFIECCKDHVNDIDVFHKLYSNGLSSFEFQNRLEEIVKPVYNAAANLGFKEWKI